MRIFLLITCLMPAMTNLFAQASQHLNENEPVVVNGIECSFRVDQESTKKAGDNEYNRYVLEFYAVNKSGCSRYLYYQNEASDFNSSPENLIATFYVRNANGKRFTSTNAKVYAKPWWVKVKSTEKDSNGKEIVRLKEMQAGYIFRRGDQLRTQITVLVPKGDKPNVEVVLQYTVE